MQCSAHHNVPAIGDCSGCGTALCEDCVAIKQGSGVLCNRCVMLGAVSEFKQDLSAREEEAEARAPKNEDSRNLPRLLQIATIAAALVLVLVQGVFVSRPVAPAPTAEEVTILDTEASILHLWKFGDQLKNHLAPSDQLLCPATNLPYVVRTVNGVVSIHDPNPGLHGYAVMQVSSQNPVPELIK